MAKEVRLIDANALIEQFNDSFKGFVMKRIVEMQPTVDAVEVVRCRDCKHYVLHGLACRNEHMNGVIGINGYCSYGERRTDNG